MGVVFCFLWKSFFLTLLLLSFGVLVKNVFCCNPVAFAMQRLWAAAVGDSVHRTCGNCASGDSVFSLDRFISSCRTSKGVARRKRWYAMHARKISHADL